jgi:MFS family permease
MLFTLLTMWWQAHLNAHHMIVDHQFHDLGKLCFAFTAFWGYLTFSQYLIIWYGNMPEETHFFRHRLTQPWATVTLTAGVLVFLLPFFGLISKAGKMYRPTMILFAVCSLVGIYLSRYVEVYPSVFATATALPFGLWELGVMLGMTGLWGTCYMAFMEAFPRMRVMLMTSPYRDEVQVPCDPRTMEPLPAHE